MCRFVECGCQVQMTGPLHVYMYTTTHADCVYAVVTKLLIIKSNHIADNYKPYLNYP